MSKNDKMCDCNQGRLPCSCRPAQQHQGDHPVAVTPEMLRAAQVKSELGTYVTANWVGAYDVLTELYRVMHAASVISADPAEVDRLRNVIEQQRNLIASLRTELAESRSIDASAEPSEPVEIDEWAEIKLDQVLRAYEYAEGHPHRYLRGTTNWCAAVAHSLNEQARAALAHKP